MSKTEALRELITLLLNTVRGETYHKDATDKAEYPYKVYSLKTFNLSQNRDDIDLCIDVFDHATNSKAVDEIGDEIEELLDGANLPQETILPTFYRNNRFPVKEDDKTIQHIQLHFTIQNYVVEEAN